MSIEEQLREDQKRAMRRDSASTALMGGVSGFRPPGCETK